MRIENYVNTRVEPLKKEMPDSQQRAAFAEMVTQSKAKLHDNALQQLMQRIEERGQLLAKRMTMQHLREYKSLVKQFLGESVKYGLELQERQGFNSKGRSRKYKIVEEIDQKLIDLTNQILQGEQNQLEILSLVGDIKGLLINIYS